MRTNNNVPFLTRYLYAPLFILLTFPFEGIAEDYLLNLAFYSTQDGLSHREVHCVFEDDQGYIWIGTKYGLNRFDGENFKWWRQTTSGFSFNNISRIAQDQDGWLWLWNDEDLAFLHPKTEEVLSLTERFGTEIPFDYKLKTKGSWKYWKKRYIDVDAQGRFYLESPKKDQLIIYDHKAGFRALDSPAIDSFGIVGVLNNGTLLLKEREGLLLVDSLLNPIKKIETPATLIYYGTIIENEDFFPVYTVQEEDKFYIRNKKGEIEYLSFWEDKNFFHSDKDGLKLWSIKGDKWNIYNKRGDIVAKMDFKNEEDLKKIPNYINYFYVDSHGRVWLGSDKGLTLAYLKKTLFNIYFNDNEGFPINNSVRGIWVDDDNIYANLEKGGFVKTTLSAPSDWELLYQSGKKLDYVEASQNYDYWGRALKRDRKGNFWIGERRRLTVYDPSTKFTQSFYKKDKSVDIDMWSLYFDEKDRIWVGTGNGLLCKMPSEDYLREAIYKENDFGLQEAVVLHIERKDDTRIWLCTNKGLYIYNIETQHVEERFSDDEKGDNFIPVSDIQHLYADSDSLIWMATVNGLLRWNFEEKTFRLFNKKDELPDNNVYAVIDDNNGHLWLSTDVGVAKFNKAHYKVTVFSLQDGLPFPEFNRIAHFSADDGTMFLGSMKGIASFVPKEMKDETIEDVSLVITDVYLFDDSSNKLEDITGIVNETRCITMKRRNPFFQVDFALLNYGTVKDNEYLYKIQGVSKNWVRLKESKLQINKLPYGNYKLFIKAISAGKPSKDILEFNIEIPKPFYYRWYFYLILSLLLVGGVIAYYMDLARKEKERQKLLVRAINKATKTIAKDKETIEKQMQELEEMYDMKSTFFSNISHEFRTPITMISNPINKILDSGVLKGNNEELLKMAQRNTDKLETLVNNIMDLTKLDAEKLKLNPKAIYIKSLTEQIIDDFIALGKTEGKEVIKNIALEANLYVELDAEKYTITLKNILSNALKYTLEGGQVKLEMKSIGKRFLIVVTDTGIGIPEDDLPHIFERYYQSRNKVDGGTGIGLALCNEFVEIMGGKIEVQSEEGKGSSFVIILPKNEVSVGADSILQKSQYNGEYEKRNDIKASTEEQMKGLINYGDTILLVEDNIELRNYIQFILSSHKFNVILASNGKEALDVLKEYNPIIVITDISMPVMDGFELAKEIKKMAYLRMLSIIFLTSRDDDHSKMKAVDLGVDDYILKPFKDEELIARINNIIYLQKSRKDFFVSEVIENEKEGITSDEKKWLNQVKSYLLENLSNPKFKNSDIALKMNISERQLQRIIKRLTGMTPKEMVRELRLNEARKQLESGKVSSVKSLSYGLGYNNPEYFSQQYQKRFGKKPSAYLSN